jgi:hypothetical protein
VKGKIVSVSRRSARVLLEHEPELRPRAIRVGDLAFAVTAVSKADVEVALGTNESVELGDAAEVTEAAPTANLVAPPASEAPWIISAGARPFFGGDRGAGVVLSGFAEARAGMIRLAAVLDKFGLSSVGSINEAYVSAALAGRYFEAGFGIGAQSLKNAGAEPPGEGLAYTTFLRVGAEDGLFLKLRPSFAIFHREHRFGNFNALFQFPLERGLAGQIEAGGGPTGYVLVGAGLRVLLTGFGSRHSNFLTFQWGYVNVQDGEGDFVNGPYAGAQFERRF